MLQQELKDNPNDPQAHYQLGLAYADIDSNTIALNHYNSALSLDNTLNNVKIEKGTVLIKQGNLLEGYKEFYNILADIKGENYMSEIARRFGQPYKIHQLSSGDFNNAYANYSPNGKKIAFQSDRDGNWEIYLMDDDAVQDIKITKNSAHDEMPIFSPNGKVIIFTSTRDDNVNKERVNMKRNIYLADVNGGQAVCVLKSGYDDWYPAFTNKNNEIILVSEMDDPRDIDFNKRLSDIYYKDLEKGTILRLTQNEADDGSPSVSFNGKWIVFNSNRDGDFQIYQMDKNGSLVEKLTSIDGNCGAPHYSRDRKWITFFAEINGNYDVYMMPVSGNGLIKLTNNSAQDGYPSFSPDGKRVIFHSNRSGKYHIYYIDLESPIKQEELLTQLEAKILSLK